LGQKSNDGKKVILIKKEWIERLLCKAIASWVAKIPAEKIVSPLKLWSNRNV